MTAKNTPPDYAEMVGKLENEVAEQVKLLKRLKDRLGRARRDLGSKPKPASLLARLALDLRKFPQIPENPDLARMADELDGSLAILRGTMVRRFQQEMKDACDAQNIRFAILPDGLGIGPLAVCPDFEKEVAALEYAKATVETRTPLDASLVLQRVRDFSAAVLTPPDDLRRLGVELEEALRVGLARQGKSLAPREWRVDLPLVYREMIHIRQASQGPVTRTTFADYPLPRFVVELKALVQSEYNAKAKRRFKLETAVIENTKDARKSVFIPRDISCGYGEGTYYQAISLLPVT